MKKKGSGQHEDLGTEGDLQWAEAPEAPGAEGEAAGDGGRPGTEGGRGRRATGDGGRLRPGVDGRVFAGG